MIITFDVKYFDTVDHVDEVVYDNCSDLRVKCLKNEKDFEYSKNHVEKCEIVPTCRVKKWINKSDICSAGNEFEKAYFVSFLSNSLHYNILTRGTTYIANDQNKTIKILN